MKEFKVEIPEGCEIDKEKSTFEKIVFKKKEKVVNCWKDLENIEGIFIDLDSSLKDWHGIPILNDRNLFLNEKYAKSALALAQISQLLPYYDSKVNWNERGIKYCIYRENDTIAIERREVVYHLLAFNTWEEAERFLKYNEQLVKDYYML